MISGFPPPLAPTPPPSRLALCLAYQREEKLCYIYIYPLVINLVRPKMITTWPFVLIDVWSMVNGAPRYGQFEQPVRHIKLN
jgi:hypothetical protein